MDNICMSLTSMAPETLTGAAKLTTSWLYELGGTVISSWNRTAWLLAIVYDVTGTPPNGMMAKLNEGSEEFWLKWCKHKGTLYLYAKTIPIFQLRYAVYKTARTHQSGDVNRGDCSESDGLGPGTASVANCERHGVRRAYISRLQYGRDYLQLHRAVVKRRRVDYHIRCYKHNIIRNKWFLWYNIKYNILVLLVFPHVYKELLTNIRHHSQVEIIWSLGESGWVESVVAVTLVAAIQHGTRLVHARIAKAGSRLADIADAERGGARRNWEWERSRCSVWQLDINVEDNILAELYVRRIVRSVANKTDVWSCLNTQRIAQR